MNIHNGWSKINNDIHDDPLLNKDSEYLSVWIYLLTHSAFAGYNVMFSGKVITLKEGQLLTSLNEIAKKTGVTTSKINRILKKLKTEKRIETQTDMQKTLVSIELWDTEQKGNEIGNDTGIRQEQDREQEREKEKEKRSKREKDKEKEINKNEKNERIYIPPYIPPLGEMDGNAPFSLSEKHGQGTGACPQDLFEEFWKAYPKKIGKGYAFECFKKIRVSRSLLDTMLEAIAKQKKSDMWKRDKGQYIPNPSTWLNQKRWEDDLGGDTSLSSEPSCRYW